MATRKAEKLSTASTTETPPTRRAPRKALVAAINPTVATAVGEPQIKVIPPSSVADTEDTETSDIRCTPTDHAISNIMFNVVTGHQRMTLRNAVTQKLKTLTEENQDGYFTVADIGHQLIMPFRDDHPNFSNLTAFKKFLLQVSGALNSIVKNKQAGPFRIVSSAEKMQPFFPDTPNERIMFGYRYEVVAPKVTTPAAPPAAVPIVYTKQPIPGHVDITPHPQGEKNAEALQELIVTMDWKQASACLDMLVSRLGDLHNSSLKILRIMSENNLAELTR